MRFQERFYPESRLGGFTDIDGTIAFYLRVNSLVGPSSVVVDFGCGRGAYRQDPVAMRRDIRALKGRVGKVIGLDIDPAAQHNPCLDEFHLLRGERWPLQDDSVDLCVCDAVLEHMERPESVFSESRRALKDGGYICVRTANAWSYVAVLGRVIPNRLHGAVLAKVQDQREEADVFPTLYRCNTIPRIRALLGRYGFDHVVYGYEAEPSYLAFSRVAYWLGTLHQRHAPALVRPVIFAFGQVHKHAA